MAYVAVSGGEEAIAASIALLDFYRSKTEKDVELEVIQEKMSLLVDRVMSEAGLYAKEYAALALKQCEGSVEEAVFLLRAYRSTLKRSYDTYVADTKNMRIVRRISSAFKDIQGGQILGATYDYTHRLMHFGLKNEDAKDLHERMEEMVEGQEPVPMEPCGRVSDELKTEGLIERFPINEEPPYDITENLLEFPASRSARLHITAHDKCHFLTLRRNGNVSCAVRSDLADDVFVYLIRQDSDIYFLWLSARNKRVNLAIMPLSTLLMLVAAYGGYDLVMEAYHTALKEDYRFGTYGDAMLILDK